MARIDINGSQVNVIEMNAGGGDPVVMIHGLYTSLSVFYFIIAPLIAREHHVVLYDLRSHGMSDRRTEGYTLEILSNDLLDLMRTLHIPHAHLVGYSYGGAIALYTAFTHPDKVKRLVLIETPALDEEAMIENANGLQYYVTDKVKDYTRSTGFQVSQNRFEKLEDQLNFLISDGLLSSAVQHDQSYADTAALKGLQPPTLLLYGTESELIETGHLFASHIPGAELQLAEGDHNLPVQQAEFVACESKRFLASLKAENCILSEGSDL